MADLAALSDVELQHCLVGLRAAIQARRHAHADAIAAGSIAPDAPLDFHAFVWKPVEKRRVDWDQRVERTTSIADLPIRRRAVHQLQQLRVLALEDLSAISELELLTLKDLGRTTVTRLRDLLKSVGLDFGDHPDPSVADYMRNQALRALTSEQRTAARAGLADEAPLSRLGLRGSTLERAKMAGWQVVGQLRAASLRDLNVRFGRKEAREVYLALQETGAGLRCNPTSLELWRAGILERSSLVKPDDDGIDVMELQPWLGTVVERVRETGIRSLGQLRAAAAAGALRKLRGVGAHSEEQILEFLGLGTRGKENITAQPASSLFGVGVASAHR